MKITYQGATANINMLKRQLEDEPLLEEVSFETRTVPKSDSAGLSQSPLLELVVDLGVGIVASAVYDVLKAGVAKARSRGPVSEESSTDDDQGEEDSGGA